MDRPILAIEMGALQMANPPDSVRVPDGLRAKEGGQILRYNVVEQRLAFTSTRTSPSFRRDNCTARRSAQLKPCDQAAFFQKYIVIYPVRLVPKYPFSL